MQHFGFSSPGTVYKYMQILKRKGKLHNEKHCSRSLSLPAEEEIPHKHKVEIQLPFIGLVKAGAPIQTFPQAQTIAVPESLIHAPDRTYVFRVMGDNLHEEYISDGDLLLVEARQEANRGETVMGLIHQYETVIKKYYPEGKFIRLVGSSPHQQPIIVRPNELQIQGVLVGLLRHYG
jgi:repressor LexA